MNLVARYKKYDTGGGIPGMSGKGASMAGGFGQAAAMVGSLADSFGPPDEYGKKPLASNLLSSAGQYAAMGSAFGPIGTGVGAAVGLGMGALQNAKQKKMADQLKFTEHLNDFRTQTSESQARVAADPTLLKGNLSAGYYAHGGNLNVANQPMKGGKAEALSSSSSELKGKTHAEGGIQLPQLGAEVEDGETTNGNYVFSKELGFADMHKPIAKAIGKIELKAIAPERINSLKLLKERENQLQLSQEYTKHTLGLN